jgi:hypothetical protein
MPRRQWAAGCAALLPETKEQTWLRSIDADGYLTIRNAGTGQCLKMAATVTTEKCVDKERSQQWLPDADQENTSLGNRAGGRLSIKEFKEGAPAVRDAGGKFVAELLGTAAASPIPTKTSEPTKTPAPTKTPEPGSTSKPTSPPSTNPTAQPTPTPGTSTTATFRSAHGTC